MIRTRFAPSPTGYLHIGGARTALFCWLYARKTGGKFILRIEDTDRERSTDASMQAILDSMQWLGLDYDEGPFFQSERFDRYRQVTQTLLESGQAYYCDCSKIRLDTLREEQMTQKQKPRYDGHCRNRNLGPSAGKSLVVRFRNPQFGDVVINDHIHGCVNVSNNELDDLIIARSDGTPTYNLTVVVDDMDMHITHVIRGDDHLNNTPRQINIFRALGAEPPQFAHVPMILGEDGKRLSKRHGAVSVMQYKEEGYLPEALLNYLVRLGWSYGDQEIFSLQEMVALFNVANINKAASALNPGKLLWLNQHYLKTLEPKYIASALAEHFVLSGLNPEAGPDLRALVTVQSDRCKTLVEMVEISTYFYQDIGFYDEKAVAKHFNAAAVEVLQQLSARFSQLSVWQAEALHEAIKTLAEQMDLKLGVIAQSLRLAVTGGTISPAIDKTLFLLGKEKTLQRINRAAEYIQQHLA